MSARFTFNPTKLEYDLIDAIKHRNPGEMERLLEAGASVTCFSPLPFAAEKGFTKGVQLLLDWGASVDALDIRMTPLHYSVRFEHVEVAQLLLSRGASTEAEAASDNATPLHVAVQHGTSKMGQLLLDHGANVNAADKCGNTPLHLAAQNGKTEMVQVLQRGRADVDVVNKKGETPLHTAAKWGSAEAAQLLLDQGANVNALDEDGMTPLNWLAGSRHSACLMESGAATREQYKCPEELYHQAPHHQIEFAKLLAEHGANVDAVDKKGWAPLHSAVRSNNAGLAQLLLEKGANVNVGFSEGDCTLWHLAGKKEVAQLLLKHGVDVNAVTKHGLTPLHLASMAGCVEVVNVLLDQGAIVDVVDNQGKTPLHHAVQHGKTGAAQLLVERGAKVNAPDNKGWTPFHQVVESRGDIELAIIFLESGANVDVADNKGRTPLHFAVKYDCTEMIQLILEQGANVDAVDSDGQTPLHCAIRLKKVELCMFGANEEVEDKGETTRLQVAPSRGRLEVVQLLLKRNADVNVANSEGRTALHMAAFLGRKEVATLLLEHGANLNTKDNRGLTSLHCAVDYGANVEVADKKGTTPMQMKAIRSGSEVVQLLLKRNADVNVANKEGRTALHVAVLLGGTKVARLLLEHGANVNAIDNGGITSLHYAIEYGANVEVAGFGGTTRRQMEPNSLDLVQLLLERRADVNVARKDGHTALHLAALLGRANVGTSLLEHGANVNTKDNRGLTSLHCAVEDGHEEFARGLLNVPETKLDVIDHGGKTPLHTAAARGSCGAGVVKLLIQKGANVGAVDSEGLTPLYYAAFAEDHFYRVRNHFCFSSEGLLRDSRLKVRLLLEGGAALGDDMSKQKHCNKKRQPPCMAPTANSKKTKRFNWFQWTQEKND